MAAPLARSQEAIAAAFAGQIAKLQPISDREGRFDYLPVRVRTYVTDLEWPEVIVVSVRAVVFRRRSVVVVRRRDGHRQVIVGGRREAGETVEQTVRREALEECGWRLASLKTLGFEHVRHLGDSPHGFPTAGFVNPIYVAEGLSFHRSARDLTQSEMGSSLRTIPQARRDLPDWGVVLLQAAVARRAVGPGMINLGRGLPYWGRKT